VINSIGREEECLAQRGALRPPWKFARHYPRVYASQWLYRFNRGPARQIAARRGAITRDTVTPSCSPFAFPISPGQGKKRAERSELRSTSFAYRRCKPSLVYPARVRARACTNMGGWTRERSLRSPIILHYPARVVVVVIVEAARPARKAEASGESLSRHYIRGKGGLPRGKVTRYPAHEGHEKYSRPWGCISRANLALCAIAPAHVRVRARRARDWLLDDGPCRVGASCLFLSVCGSLSVRRRYFSSRLDINGSLTLRTPGFRRARFSSKTASNKTLLFAEERKRRSIWIPLLLYITRDRFLSCHVLQRLLFR